MSAGTTTHLDLAKLPNRLERGIYVSVSEMDAVSPVLPCAHTVRRLFEDLELDGVLYVGRMPRAVFKRVRRVRPADVRRWQRTVWNHAVTPILVLFSDTQVWVYSGQSLPARPDQEPDADRRLVEKLDSVAEVLEFDNLVMRLESGEVFRGHSEYFDRQNAVDGYLLKNIEVAAKRLCECSGKRLELVEAHRLLLRLLFTCYLIDREMISGQHFPKGSPLKGLERNHGLRAILDELGPPKQRDTLCQLFQEIGRLFNGSAFDAKELARERDLLSDQHVGVLMRFLHGDSLGDNQLALGFWAYDFKHIPIETVSAIYESFLGDVQGGLRQETGAYYTPPHLAELVIDIALEGLPKPLLDCTVLDPACGSGTFLVGIFNRMAEQWRLANPRRANLTRARELQRMVKTQLHGIDVNPTACEIACFSLYLAYLDQLEPRDVEELRQHEVRLPKLLLRNDEEQGSGDPRTVINRNFFAVDRQLPREEFDLVVGNPPWVSRGKATDPKFLAWLDRPEAVAPSKQIACGFLWETLKLLTEGGRGCLLVPAALLVGETSEFQEKWFSTVAVERIVDFSDLRKLLFPGAKHPCVAMRYHGVPPVDTASISYEVPKTDIVSQQRGPVLVREEDISIVPTGEIVWESREGRGGLAWKTRLWGTPRDRRFLQRLADMPPIERLAGEPKEHKRWIKGRGLQARYAGSDEKPAWWTHSTPFLDARRLPFLPSQGDCHRVGDRFDLVHRLPYEEVCTPPFIVATQGARQMKVAFVDFTAVFRHSLYAICGPERDTHLLRFLAAFLKSRLAAYFLFHTSGSLGTERDKTHFFELLRLPFPLPEDTSEPKRSHEIVSEVSREVEDLGRRIRSGELDLGREEAVDALQRRIEPYIREYYDVDDCEQMLIEDTLGIHKPSSTPGSPTTSVPALSRPKPQDRLRYVDTLCSALKSHTVPAFKDHITGTITLGPGVPVALVTLSTSGKARPTSERTAPKELSRSLWRLARSLPSGQRSLAYVRNVKIVEQGRIHVVKPLTLRSWTRTAALNDADEIFGAMLMRRARH